MGEKSGGLWLIVIVVVLAGLLIVGLSAVFGNSDEGAIGAIKTMFENMLNSGEFSTNGGS